MIRRSRILKSLALVNAISASLALLLSGVLILELTRSQLQSDFEKRILTQTQLVAGTLGAAVLFEDWTTAEEFSRSLFVDSAVCTASITDSLGVTKVEIQNSCTVKEKSTHWLAAVIQRLTMKTLVTQSSGIIVAGQLEGQIEVVATNLEVFSALGNLFWKLLGTTLCALALIVWFTMKGQARLVEPVTLLSSTVQRVRETGNYSLRGRVSGDDEISQLATDVNAMLELIEERDQFLAREIEAGVKGLKLKNDELEAEIERRSKSDKALEESQQRFAKAFQNAPIGMAILDRDGTVVLANQAIDSLLKAKSTGRQIQEFLSSSDQLVLFEALDYVFSSYGVASKEQYGIKAIGGDDLTCNVSLSAIPDVNGDLSHCILQVEDVTGSVKLSAELEFQALHDALTGLGNRRVLEVALFEANQKAASVPFSMALLDLDQFKVVNDTCGHEAGDKLLIDIAQLLRESVRTDDVVVRLGGDEFALLLHDCLEADALAISEKVRTAVENLVFLWRGESFRVGTSIGLLTVTAPFPDAADILRRADAACFAAKDAGRNRVYQAEEDDTTLAKNRGDMHWVNRIQQALEHDEFILYAQPIVPLQPVTGPPRMEILLRLRDYEKKRLIPPGAFLPAVERYGMSSRLDRWVVTMLIKQIRAYIAEFDDERSYWVNLSGISLSDPRFLEFLVDEIGRSTLPKGTLNFEVTETAVISNMVAAKLAMGTLQTLGCKFALDDFGAGVSTFSYLRNLPIDFVKVDGSFIKNLRTDEADRIFVKSVIDIVRVLEIGTVVEFVEDDATASLLTSMGANYGQGFALGRPAPLLPAPAYRSLIEKVAS